MDFFDPENMTPEMAEWARGFVPPPELNGGPLVRVIAIGQAIAVDDITVELIALEVREAGAFLHWKAITPGDRMLGAILVDVSDDRGTAYRTHSGEYGGGRRVWKGDLILVPPPPPDVSSVHVRVRGFSGFPEMPFQPANRDPVEGVWDFRFETDPEG